MLLAIPTEASARMCFYAQAAYSLAIKSIQAQAHSKKLHEGGNAF